MTRLADSIHAEVCESFVSLIKHHRRENQTTCIAQERAQQCFDHVMLGTETLIMTEILRFAIYSFLPSALCRLPPFHLFSYAFVALS